MMILFVLQILSSSQKNRCLKRSLTENRCLYFLKRHRSIGDFPASHGAFLMGIEVFSLAMLTTPTSPFFFGLDFNHPQSFFRFTALDLPHEKLTLSKERTSPERQFNWTGSSIGRYFCDPKFMSKYLEYLTNMK